MDKKAVVQFYHPVKRIPVDLEIPLDVPASELLFGISEAFSLGISEDMIAQCCLKTEDPIALLTDSRTPEECGVHDGTKLYLDRRKPL